MPHKKKSIQKSKHIKHQVATKENVSLKIKMYITGYKKYTSNHKIVAYLQTKTLEIGEGLQISPEEARSPARSGSTLEVFFRTSAVMTTGSTTTSPSKGGSKWHPQPQA